MKASKILSFGMIFTFIVIAFSQSSFAQDEAANKQIDKDSKEVLETGKRLQEEKTKEEMRDKTHDNGYKTGENTSVHLEKDGVSIKKTFP